LKYFTSLSFIDASTGWATGENARSDGVVRLYVTHDGGATWQSGALLPDPAGAVSFSDADHGWVASSTNADLWATSDGGRTWTKVASGGLAAYAGGGSTGYNYLNFVSPQIGWAEQQGTDYSTLLFKTTDGGRTWTQINFSISG
jgi:photosystem II stability/assembly factor-like uncharacterized protein